jgi:hypothetical protein
MGTRPGASDHFRRKIETAATMLALTAQVFHLHSFLAAPAFCIFAAPVAIYDFGQDGRRLVIPRVTVVGLFI